MKSLFPPRDGLRLVPIPEAHMPDYVSGSSLDPDTLRVAAEAHGRSPGASSGFTVKPWVVLYLLAVWEAAAEAAEWHARRRDRTTSPTRSSTRP